MWQLNETTNIIRTDLIDNDQCIALSRAVNSSHWANRRKPWMRESERRRPPKPGLEGNVQLDLHSSLPLSPAEDVDVLTRGSGLITWRRRAFLNSPALRSVIGFPRCDYRGDLYEPFRLRIRHRKIHQIQSTVFLRGIQLGQPFTEGDVRRQSVAPGAGVACQPRQFQSLRIFEQNFWIDTRRAPAQIRTRRGHRFTILGTCRAQTGRCILSLGESVGEFAGAIPIGASGP